MYTLRFFIILALIGVVIYSSTLLTPSGPTVERPSDRQQNVDETPSDDRTSSNGSVRYQNTDYQFHYRKMKSSESLSLIPNFGERLTSSEIIDAYDCTFGINGGFYQENTDPLGLFYTDGTEYGSYIPSATFDGILAVRKRDARPVVLAASATPTTRAEYSFLMQSGPFFDLSRTSEKRFIDREYARRNIVAVDANDGVYLFTIFQKESRYAGPRLEDIPELFKDSAIADIAPFTRVLNLDGGTASSFYDASTTTHIKEIKIIGSFLCGQS